MSKKILIIGGGTAGWLTAGYLARRLSADLPGGASIRLIQSHEIGSLGVGEGTFPTIRRTLATIGIDEAEMVRRCGATFKQGAKFVDWRNVPGTAAGPDHYLHAFQVAENPDGLELLPYWLLGAAGDEAWDAASTPQKKAADAYRAPKLPSHPSFVGPLNYAFHFDAVTLAEMLRDHAIVNGVDHIADTVTEVMIDASGAIEAVRTQSGDMYDADLYIDCTGFRAELIGKALGVPYRSCRDVLFCDRAIAIQVPYSHPRSQIASHTISTARESGWIWDIGLDGRRGIGHVYSSDHMDDPRAEEVLSQYVGPAAAELETRKFRFDAGFREVNWRKNCVAIGLSSGFFEPLEATGIIFCEVAASLVANLFPWGGDYETSARQFNSIMLRRYERTLDFIKLHYCISKRRDTQFWRDNVDPLTIPDSLHDLLERWRFRPPSEIDVDQLDLFTPESWQYVLYGMGWKTDLSAKAGIYRYTDDARAAFAEVRRQAQFAIANLPTNRELIEYARTRSFGPQNAAAA
jgi:glycine/D-amino acid oxidase-like deaminating enzyme